MKDKLLSYRYSQFVYSFVQRSRVHVHTRAYLYEAASCLDRSVSGLEWKKDSNDWMNRGSECVWATERAWKERRRGV